MIPVVVVWKDAHSGSNSWLQVDGYEDDGDCQILSMGFFCENLKNGHVALAQSVDPDNNVDSLLFIPEEMVQGIVVLNGKGFPERDEDGSIDTTGLGSNKVFSSEGCASRGGRAEAVGSVDLSDGSVVFDENQLTLF